MSRPDGARQPGRSRGCNRRRLPLGETRRCFACTTTLTIRDGLVRDIVPGVTCEACHGLAGRMATPFRKIESTRAGRRS